MKQIILLLLLVAFTANAIAQDDNYRNDDIQTLFSKYKSNGAYGALTFGYSQIDGKDAFITGARGAFIINRSFAIGLGGYGFVNDFDYRDVIYNNPVDVGLAGGYGGLYLEPILGSRLPVHLSFPVLFGVGGVATIEDSDWFDYYYENQSDVYLVVEPAIELELNLTKFLRAAAFISYRYTSDIEITNIDPEVLKKWNVGITFKLGKF